jgi:hypothetical protein
VLLQRLNDQRADAGLPTLSYNTTLSSDARAASSIVAEEGPTATRPTAENFTDSEGALVCADTVQNLSAVDVSVSELAQPVDSLTPTAVIVEDALVDPGADAEYETALSDSEYTVVGIGAYVQRTDDTVTVTVVQRLCAPAPEETPTPTEPTPTEPTPTEPTEPAPTEETPTEPTPTEPAPTEETPTEPTPTPTEEPIPTEEPTPTEPEPIEETSPPEETPIAEPTPTEEPIPTEETTVPALTGQL